MVLLTGCVGSTIGLLMGTVIKPDQISLMFTLIFTPLLFTGCTYYPWGALSSIRWFQVLTLLNPLTYAAEGLRYSMVPPMANGHDFPTLGVQWSLLCFAYRWWPCLLWELELSSSELSASYVACDFRALNLHAGRPFGSRKDNHSSGKGPQNNADGLNKRRNVLT